ncbi:MarR family transcriptional regulator [Amnibacterium setariae]|uniref:MarR family transcriptional regulator n=2 Tax=Amnibacterium setariae TaxID=2306585 RepID=A0A3A1U443_9MICO|nr:MarR family transcriptional regulator [Amnibacterium setariae]
MSDADWAFWDSWMRAQRRMEREVDRALQQDFDISKSEFGILVTLRAAPGGAMRVTELAESLGWEKGRVAHLLTRMEARGFLEREEAGAAGRRTGITLTAVGAERVDRAVLGHGRVIRRLVLDRLAPDQVQAISAWSRAMTGDGSE